MTATPTQFIITDEELASLDEGGGSYADIEAPAEHVAVLSLVEDYDNTSKGKTKGWIFTFRIQGLPFKVWVAHSKASRWKLRDTVNAFRPGLLDQRDEEGRTPVIDPTEWIGEEVIALVVLDEELDTPRKVIDEIYAIEDEVDIESVPAI